jgi:hypothetical protein
MTTSTRRELYLAALPRCGLTPAEAPLIDAEILFRQGQLPHSATLWRLSWGRFLEWH